MKINWKLRLQNKATLIAILFMVISISYTLMGMFGIVPSITAEQWKDFVGLIVQLLVLLGVVVDPSTAGLDDSKQTMDYKKPRKSL